MYEDEVFDPALSSKPEAELDQSCRSANVKIIVLCWHLSDLCRSVKSEK